MVTWFSGIWNTNTLEMWDNIDKQYRGVHKRRAFPSYRNLCANHVTGCYVRAALAVNRLRNRKQEPGVAMGNVGKNVGNVRCPHPIYSPLQSEKSEFRE